MLIFLILCFQREFVVGLKRLTWRRQLNERFLGFGKVGS